MGPRAFWLGVSRCRVGWGQEERLFGNTPPSWGYFQSPRCLRKPGPKVDKWLQARSQISQRDPWDTPTCVCGARGTTPESRKWWVVYRPPVGAVFTFENNSLAQQSNRLLATSSKPLAWYRLGCGGGGEVVGNTPPLRGGVSKVKTWAQS